MFQVFKFAFVVAYVECSNKIVAQKMIEQYLSNENCKYLGEYNSIVKVMECDDAYFIGYDKHSYEDFLKRQGGYVKFMVNYLENNKSELAKIKFNY